MKITIICGQNHKGSTYHIARMVAEKMGGEITEFFLPKDFGEFCVGCANCFVKDEKCCPHYERLSPITQAMDEADVIILASPVYVYHVTGAMKAFLDHYGYRWMVHRPEEKMYTKQAICITTAAGAGLRSTLKDMKDSTFFWGIAKTYSIGMAVRAISWDHTSDKTRKAIDVKTTKVAAEVRQNQGHITSGLKTKVWFYAMRMVQKTGWNPVDSEYWKKKGWTKKDRPWKA